MNNLSSLSGGGKRMKHRHTDSADEFKRRQLRSIRQTKLVKKILFRTLLVVAVIVLAIVLYVYSD